MAYGYNANNIPPSGLGQLTNQNVQPLFPQPQGNVYQINSTLEVANVPVGAGISIALCLPENVMYIKTMQNGNPLFYPYKIEPLTERKETQNTSTPSTDETILQQLASQIQSQEERIKVLEESQSKRKGDFNI